MTKKLQSITSNLYPAFFLLVLIAIWQYISVCGVVPSFMLPSPIEVVKAFYKAIPDFLVHGKITLIEAFVGLGFSIILAFILSILMDRFNIVYKSFYPLLVVSQTIPVVAIAPLLVLWMGYGITPKITLIVLVCFFPLAVNLLDSFKSVDLDAVQLLKTMGANNVQIFRHIKLPYSMPSFFAGLKISVSYSIVGAVISEWLGGDSGLGVYMTRVRKSYEFDKMFAVIFLIILISLVLIFMVSILEKRVLKWSYRKDL